MTFSRPAAPQMERVLLGYAAGVAAATFAFGAALFVPRFGGGQAQAHLLETLALTALPWAFVTALAAVLPCLVAECLARLLGRRPAWWFALWGAATGLASGPLFLVGIFGPGDNYGVPITWPEAHANVLRATGAAFAASGAAGGLAYWGVSRRSRARPMPGPAPAHPP